MVMIRMCTTKKEIDAALREKHTEMMPKTPNNHCPSCHALKSIDAMRQAKPLHSSTTNPRVTEKY
jgi:hypothetical protein